MQDNWFPTKILIFLSKFSRQIPTQYFRGGNDKFYFFKKKFNEIYLSLITRRLNLNSTCSLFLSFRYGPIHSLYVGPEPVVIVSDYSIMSDLFKRDEAQGRAPFHPYHTLRPGAKERDGTGNASWAPGK